MTQPDGKILVGGRSAGGNASAGTVVRHDADGARDSSFGEDGIVTLGIGTVRAIHLVADGKVLVQADRLARLNADGSLDLSFGE